MALNKVWHYLIYLFAVSLHTTNSCSKSVGSLLLIHSRLSRVYKRAPDTWATHSMYLFISYMNGHHSTKGETWTADKIWTIFGLTINKYKIIENVIFYLLDVQRSEEEKDEEGRSGVRGRERQSRKRKRTSVDGYVGKLGLSLLQKNWWENWWPSAIIHQIVNAHSKRAKD